MNEWGKVPIWWTHAIAKQPRHRFNALQLAVVLSRRRDQETNQCYPSYATLQEDTGLSEKRLSEAVATLVACGIVSVQHRRRKSVLYTVCFDIPADVGSTFLDIPGTVRPKNQDPTAPGNQDPTAAGIKTRQRLHGVSPSVSPSIISYDDGLIKNQSRDEIADALRANGVANAEAEANEIRRSIGPGEQRALLFLEALEFAVSHQGYHSPIGFAINRASAGLGAPVRGERRMRTVTDAEIAEFAGD